jgi:hypothetical protein
MEKPSRRLGSMTVAAGRLGDGPRALAEAFPMGEQIVPVLAMGEEVVQGSFA